jgi:multiple sugar transport system permease protein
MLVTMSRGKAQHPRTGSRVLKRVLAYVLTTALALLFMVPFLWMMSMSLQDMVQLTSWPPNWIPNPARWSNYPKAMTYPGRPFGLFFKNSLTYTVIATLGVTFASSITAYAFARLRARPRDILFVLVLSTMMLPSQVTLIPQYFIFKELGWLDTLKPLIIPQCFGSAFYIFLFRQFFMTIPIELDEAAVLDGCTLPGIFFRIIMPLAKPVTVTVIAFSVVGTWNQFFEPLIFLNSTENMTIAVGLRLFAAMGTDAGFTDVGVVTAAAVCSMTPMIVMFLACQRYFVEGITMTGLKG